MVAVMEYKPQIFFLFSVKRFFHVGGSDACSREKIIIIFVYIYKTTPRGVRKKIKADALRAWKPDLGKPPGVYDARALPLAACGDWFFWEVGTATALPAYIYRERERENDARVLVVATSVSLFRVIIMLCLMTP